MSNDKNGLLGLLMLSALLGGNRPRQAPEELEFDLSDILGRRRSQPDPLTCPPELASMYLSSKDFEVFDDLDVERFNTIKDEFNKLDPRKLDTVMVVALYKEEPTGEPCTGCGEVHDEDSVGMLAGFVGKLNTGKALANIAFSQANGRGQMPGFGAMREVRPDLVDRPSDARFGDNLAHEAEETQTRG